MESACLKTNVVTSEVDVSLSRFSFFQSGLRVEPDLLLFSVSSFSKESACLALNRSRFREMLACCTWHQSCDLQSTASVFQPHLCRASCDVLTLLSAGFALSFLRVKCMFLYTHRSGAVTFIFIISLKNHLSFQDFSFLLITWVLQTNRLAHVWDSVLNIFLTFNLKIIIH